MATEETVYNERALEMRKLQMQIDAMLKNAGMSSMDAYTLSVDIFHAIMNSDIVDECYIQQYKQANQ